VELWKITHHCHSLHKIPVCFYFFLLHSRFLLFLHRDCLSSPPRAGALPSAAGSPWPAPGRALLFIRTGYAPRLANAGPAGHALHPTDMRPPWLALRWPRALPQAGLAPAPSPPLVGRCVWACRRKKPMPFFSHDAWVRASLI
jgi:hypothetical protein